MIELVKNKDHLVRKRKGHYEQFSSKKLYRAILWTCNGNEAFADEIMKNLSIKIHNKITIEKLWDAVIETIANMITEMYTAYDQIAVNAYILKIYKESFNMEHEIDDQKYLELVHKGISSNIYSRKTFESFEDEEILKIASFIRYDRDLEYSYIGIRTMMNKSCFKYSKTKHLELPQHVYMRMAIEAFKNEEDKKERLTLIKDRYDYLSLFQVTEASPKVLSSGTDSAQLASCVLMEIDDNSESINYIDNALGMMSRFGAGNAINTGALRASGSAVGKHGQSSGPVKFIQGYGSTIKKYDQLGARSGACVITNPFWHMDIRAILMLKDAGGSAEQRARELQYSIQWYSVLSERIRNNGDITLFDPKDTPDLLKLWGKEFDDRYKFYEQKAGIKKTVIPAQELGFLIAKIRAETGNLYIVFPDNINAQRIGEEPVFASNLCCEVMLPTKTTKNFKTKIMRDFETGKIELHEKKDVGEIALCNLSSINLLTWSKMKSKEKHRLMYNLLRASDNMIDSQFYPIADGAIANTLRRPIGIGDSNYANFLATNKTLFTDEEAAKLTHEIFEDVQYYILFNSNKLAKERGAYSFFQDSKWAEGILPFDMAICSDLDDGNTYDFPLLHNWDSLRADIIKYGVRFSYHSAIAPTATSGLIINATEGVEPITSLFSMKDGTTTLPAIVPNLVKQRQWYQSAFDIPNVRINTLAAIRGKFIDQGQSVTHYYVKTNSAYAVITDIMDAFKKGMKSIYYLQPMKAEMKQACESCSA